MWLPIHFVLFFFLLFASIQFYAYQSPLFTFTAKGEWDEIEDRITHDSIAKWLALQHSLHGSNRMEKRTEIFRTSRVRMCVVQCGSLVCNVQIGWKWSQKCNSVNGIAQTLLTQWINKWRKSKNPSLNLAAVSIIVNYSAFFCSDLLKFTLSYEYFGAHLFVLLKNFWSCRLLWWQIAATN